ncbi:MAG: RND transporter [Magnetococcales bacterium]|nr:RND transporter [Magnetococcales bacterium]
MGIAPVAPEPHLWEKLRMLANGTLSRPLDIFDLLMHVTPSLLVLIKGIRQLRAEKGTSS